MEFVSGYRDEFLDFAALLFGWFHKFMAERGAVGTSPEGRWQQLEAQIRRLPQDPALWVLHVLPNRSVGISLMHPHFHWLLHPLLTPQDGPEGSVRPSSGVSARLSSGMREKGGRRDLQIKVSSRPYHLLQGPKPDLVIGFNSGFGLKDTWLSSLPRLQSLRVPAFFTESSEYGCVMDDQTMAVATGGGTSPPQPNPFRSPFRLRAADNCMPWYCNAFIFHLVYKPPQGGGTRSAPVPAPPAPTPAAPPAPARRRRGEKKPGRGSRRRR